ncbi:hypothetical protein [Bordetella bronchiseptica]|uniref:hypothetical protein n=1 Tax=Bordetella bronchiseptica TaxID=518 RepID=UPI0005290E7D|nr:hypothetical protein [Bordetella bronchiseptica]
MTLLELFDQILPELGFPKSSSVMASQERTVQQIFALANRLGRDLTRDYDWRMLMREHILITEARVMSASVTEGSYVVTVADTSGLTTAWGLTGEGVRPFSQIISVDSPTQVTLNMPADKSGAFDLTFSKVEYPLPSDWKKQLPQTEWDRTNRWPLIGPQTPQMWQSLKSGIVYAGIGEHFRIVGNSINVTPPPANGLLIGFEYLSKNWVLGSDGVAKEAFTADDDTFIYDSSLLVLGVKSLFFQAKGFDSSLETTQFSALIDRARAQDNSAPALSLTGRFGRRRFIDNCNIPEGNWGH